MSPDWWTWFHRLLEAILSFQAIKAGGDHKHQVSHCGLRPTRRLRHLCYVRPEQRPGDYG